MQKPYEVKQYISKYKRINRLKEDNKDVIITIIQL